ncbi:MAG: hypothetical protein RSF90_05480, partial [Pygmaiobacter sp.]
MDETAYSKEDGTGCMHSLRAENLFLSEFSRRGTRHFFKQLVKVFCIAKSNHCANVCRCTGFVQQQLLCGFYANMQQVAAKGFSGFLFKAAAEIVGAYIYI